MGYMIMSDGSAYTKAPAHTLAPVPVVEPAFQHRHALAWAEWQGLDADAATAYADWYVAQGFLTQDDFMVSHSDLYPRHLRDQRKV